MIQLIAPAGWALLKAAGLTTAAGLGAYGLSEIPGAIEESILKAGPNNPDDPTKFKTNPLQNLLIDEENLTDKYFKRQRTRLYDTDPKVRKRVNLLGHKKEDIGFRDSSAYLADTKEEAERLTTNKDLTKELQGMPGGGALYAELGDKPTNAQLRRAIIKADAADPYGGGRGTLIAQEQLASDLRKEETRRWNTDRLDILESQLRADRNKREERRMDMDLSRMQFDMQNRRLDMQEARNFRLDRQRAILKIVEGMQNMGNAFAY